MAQSAQTEGAIYEVGLKGMTFFAYHGVYAEEKINGNTFRVDLILGQQLPNPKRLNDLNLVLNYEILARVAKEVMEQPRELLEQVALEMGRRLMEEESSTSWVKVRIAKANPPINIVPVESSEVYLELNRSHFFLS